MACRFSSYCLALVAVVCCCSSSIAAQANRHPVFPTKLAFALGLQPTNSVSAKKASRQEVKSEFRAQADGHQSVLLSPTHASPKSGRRNQNQPDETRKSLDPNDVAAHTLEKSESKHANLRHRPFANASHRISESLNASTSRKRVPDQTDWFGTVMTFPAQRESGAKIIVRQPDAMPGNEYSFVVENVGSETAQPFSVEFRTPPEITVLRAFPFNAEQMPHSVVVHYERLEAGKTSPVHIKTSTPRRNDFVIETHIRMEKKHAFKVQADVASRDENHQQSPSNSDPASQGEDYQFVFEDEANQPLGTQSAGSTAAVNAQRSSVLEPIQPNGPDSEVLLSSTLAGPESLTQGEEQIYEIAVANPSSQVAENIVVQLTLPDGLMVTNLDREAWIDQELRTISWRLDALGAMEMNKIRYRVKAVGAGDQLHRIVIGMNDVYQGEIRLTSSIYANSNQPLNLRPYLGN